MTAVPQSLAEVHLPELAGQVRYVCGMGVSWRRSG